MSESHSHPGYKFCVWSKTFHVLRLLYQVKNIELATDAGSWVYSEILSSILRAYTEGVYLVTKSRDRKSLQIPYTEMPEKMGN